MPCDQVARGLQDKHFLLLYLGSASFRARFHQSV